MKMMNLLELLVKRLLKAKNSNQIFILTSNDVTDNRLVKFCEHKGLNFFRGELHNVYKRFRDFLKMYEYHAIVRISADSPMLDYKLVESMISFFKVSDYDILTNIFPRSFPSGQSVEIIRFQALKKIKKIISLTEKEHVTKFFYKNHKSFKIYNLVCPYNHKDLKLSIDDINDFNRFVKLIRRVGESFSRISIREIIRKW